jgi:hypothetical protein
MATAGTSNAFVFDKQTTFSTPLKTHSISRRRPATDGWHMITFSLTAYSHKSGSIATTRLQLIGAIVLKIWFNKTTESINDKEGINT